MSDTKILTLIIGLLVVAMGTACKIGAKLDEARNKARMEWMPAPGDPGKRLVFNEPTEDEILTFPGVTKDGKAFPLTYSGPKGKIWVDEDGEIHIEGEITMDEACRKFWQTLASTYSEVCNCDGEVSHR